MQILKMLYVEGNKKSSPEHERNINFHFSHAVLCAFYEYPSSYMNLNDDVFKGQTHRQRKNAKG